jgi:hypothetical protein
MVYFLLFFFIVFRFDFIDSRLLLFCSIHTAESDFQYGVDFLNNGPMPL